MPSVATLRQVADFDWIRWQKPSDYAVFPTLQEISGNRKSIYCAYGISAYHYHCILFTMTLGF
jgi:hypothetical protein